jgi:hypothetical protein
MLINLAADGRPQSIRKIVGMKRSDVRRAERIVADNTDYLLQRWKEIWE